MGWCWELPALHLASQVPGLAWLKCPWVVGEAVTGAGRGEFVLATPLGRTLCQGEAGQCRDMNPMDADTPTPSSSSSALSTITAALSSGSRFSLLQDPAEGTSRGCPHSPSVLCRNFLSLPIHPLPVLHQCSLLALTLVGQADLSLWHRQNTTRASATDCHSSALRGPLGGPWAFGTLKAGCCLCLCHGLSRLSPRWPLGVQDPQSWVLLHPRDAGPCIVAVPKRWLHWQPVASRGPPSPQPWGHGAAPALPRPRGTGHPGAPGGRCRGSPPSPP